MFFRWTHFTYNGDLPSLQDFLEWMDSPQVIQAKKRFHENHRGIEWNFKIQLQKFSKQIVDILLWTCLNFLKECFNFQAKLFNIESNPLKLFLHPFSQDCLTLPSYSYKVLNLGFLNEESIFSTSKQNKSFSENVSRPEFEFCLFMEWKSPQNNYRHAFNHVCGQKRFSSYSVDLYSPILQEVYFFHGCYTHVHTIPGCTLKRRESITKDNADKKNSRMSFEEARKRDLDIEKFLFENFKDEIKTIRYIYECEWISFKKTPEYKTFQEQHKTILLRPLHRLEPRVAQRGGFLDTYGLEWSKLKNPTEIFKYADLNALYSFISVENNFPVGKPIILLGSDVKEVSFQNKTLFFKDEELNTGFIFCKISAPRTLKIPFLQYRLKTNEVVLALCKTCAENNLSKCRHRCLRSTSFTSVWTIPEVNFALKLNYVVEEIYEIHYFCSNKPILKEYVQKLVSLRYLNSFENQDSKENYCNNINQSLNLTEDFKLIPSMLTFNEMKKNFIKIQLNSSFGRFSSNTRNIKNHVIVQSQTDLENLARKHKILHLEQLNPDAVMVTLDGNERHFDRQSNLYIGSHISAFARIFLYEKIQILLDKKITIYSADTDALSYSLPKSVSDPLKFSYLLGDFKSVYGDLSEITHFYSLGNRNYCVVFKNQNDCFQNIIKCKGLSLESSFNSNILTPELYHQFISSYVRKELLSIKIEQQRSKLKKTTSPKEFKMLYFTFSNNINFKRIICDTKTSLPFGFKQ